MGGCIGQCRATLHWAVQDNFDTSVYLEGMVELERLSNSYDEGGIAVVLVKM